MFCVFPLSSEDSFQFSDGKFFFRVEEEKKSDEQSALILDNNCNDGRNSCCGNRLLCLIQFQDWWIG